MKVQISASEIYALSKQLIALWGGARAHLNKEYREYSRPEVLASNWVQELVKFNQRLPPVA